MANDPDPQDRDKRGFWASIKEHWAQVTFGIAAIVAITGSYLDTQALASDAKELAEELRDEIDVERNARRSAIENRASKFLTEQEFDRLWKELEDQGQSVDEIEATINALILSDERTSAKIDLAEERLRREIQEQASSQNQLLNQILRELGAN